MEQPIVVAQTFPTSPANLWRAITEPARMRQWFFETIADFEPRVGGEFSFVVNAEGTDYLHRWNVLEVVPERRLVYRWRYDGIPGDSTVTWELTRTGTDTTLTLTHAGHETFPRTPVFARDVAVAGWTYFICERLVAFLQPSRGA